jgi:hypothetical protein
MSDWTWNNKSKLQNMDSCYIPCRFRRNVKFRDQSGRIPGLHLDSGRNTRGRVKTSEAGFLHQKSTPNIPHHSHWTPAPGIVEGQGQRPANEALTKAQHEAC